MTDTGVLYQGKFFPFRFAILNSKSVPEVGIRNTDKLFINRIFWDLLYANIGDGTYFQITGTPEFPAISVNIIYQDTSTAKYFNGAQTLNLFMDLGSRISYTAANATAAQVRVIYSLVDTNDVYDYNEKSHGMTCGFIDWLRGECIHGIT